MSVFSSNSDHSSADSFVREVPLATSGPQLNGMISACTSPARMLVFRPNELDIHRAGRTNAEFLRPEPSPSCSRISREARLFGNGAPKR